MPGVGISSLGVFGMGSMAGIDLNRSLGVFNFQAVARSEGFIIDVSVDIPGLLEASDWNRSLLILRKCGEWPQSYDDPDADIILEHTYTLEGSITVTVADIDLAAGKNYYYCLYEQRNDLTWIHDSINGKASAYPYDRWGFGDYIFSSLPRGWQHQDANQELYNFCQIFGALFDDIKTDTEYLKTLFEITNIHDDLIQYLDAKIAWPTWHTEGGLRRREETAQAVNRYKIVGTRPGIESMIENASTWSATVYEGWKYVMFSNGLYDSKTPGPFPDSSFIANIGLITDKYKYTNDNTTERSWHSVNGYVLDLNYIPGTSDPITDEVESRIFELLSQFKTSYSNADIIIEPIP